MVAHCLHNIYTARAVQIGKDRGCMYARSFQKAAHVRRFTVVPAASGWDVGEEHDDRLVRKVRYHDWHRVERAIVAFKEEAATLKEAGWKEARESTSRS